MKHPAYRTFLGKRAPEVKAAPGAKAEHARPIRRAEGPIQWSQPTRRFGTKSGAYRAAEQADQPPSEMSPGLRPLQHSLATHPARYPNARQQGARPRLGFNTNTRAGGGMRLAGPSVASSGYGEGALDRLHRSSNTRSTTRRFSASHFVRKAWVFPIPLSDVPRRIASSWPTRKRS